MEAKNPQENQTPDGDLLSETQITHDFFQYLNIKESQEIDENEEEEEEEVEFSFMSGEPDTSPISAEDAFMDGKIKPVFPLFNRDLLFSSVPDLPNYKPNVDKVFVEMPKRVNDHKVTSFAARNDVIPGPSSDWLNREAVEVAPENCKKSNSTGFSRIWRFKEFMGRSNSGGRDAFVFLNNGQAPHDAPVKSPAPAVVVVKGSKKKVERKGKKATVSAHEVYLKSKSKAEKGRRSTTSSYLPYRPALMGFFTNVNGGLTKNVHPY